MHTYLVFVFTFVYIVNNILNSLVFLIIILNDIVKCLLIIY
jgi:hypothetical protein